MSEDIEIPTQYTHSFKITDTAEGIRLTVHVFANDKKTALEEAFELYGNARAVAKDNNIQLAPFTIKEIKKK